MANVVLTVLSLTIGFFFILVGSLKISAAVNEEVYREMRKVFIRHAKVFPLYALTGWKPNPHTLRKVVGSTEVVGGIILAIIPGPLKQLANVLLFIIMCGAVYGHYALKDGMDKMTPALVFGLLLACRFVVHHQIRMRDERELKELIEAQEKLRQHECASSGKRAEKETKKTQ